jgi:sugar/nucleoside kinase (ribokinase family)
MDLVVIGVIDIHTVLRTSLKTGITNPVTELSEKFSGSALRIAVNASLLKADVGIISPVGRDAVGLMDILKRYNVDYSQVVLSMKKNANFIELYTPTRYYTLYYQGALSDLKAETIKREYINQAKVVHVSFPDEKLAEYVVNMAKKENVVTSVEGITTVDADITFTEEEKEMNNTIVFSENKIVCNGKTIPLFKDDIYHKNGVKEAFIAAFLTRYIQSEHAENAALYGSCAAYLCSKSEKSVLTCTKEELTTLFEQKR